MSTGERNFISSLPEPPVSWLRVKTPNIPTNQGIFPNGEFAHLPAATRSWIPVLLITYHNGRSLGIFRNGEKVRMLRTCVTGSLVICP